MSDLTELKTIYMECYSKMLTCSWLVESVWRDAREHARQDLRAAGVSIGSIHSLEKIVCKEINHQWIPEN
jgi:hypothetical protein